LFAPNDVHALATCLAALQRDPDRRARLAAAAVQRIPRVFSREKLLDDVQGLYDRLIGV
jgi:hypothetical protein